MLDLVPAQLRVKVIRRPRYGCRACAEAVVQAPAPERPITGGMATEALLAHVLVAKYCRPFCRCTAGADLRPARDRARPLDACAPGWGGPAGGWSRCGASCAGTSWARPRIFGRRHALAGARSRPGPDQDGGCGATRSTTGPGAARPRRRWSTSTPRTARASTRRPLGRVQGILQVDGYAASRACWRAARRTGSSSRSVGRIAGGASTSSTGPPARRWQRRRCAGSASSTRSRPEIRGRPAEERRAARQERSRPIVEALHCLAHDPAGAGLRALHPGRGDPLRPAPLDGAGAVPRGRPDRARHEHHRAGHPADRPRAQEQPVRRARMVGLVTGRSWPAWWRPRS
jgi:hypothetical protein